MVAARAQAEGADLLITTGGVQSNHCRVTAAAAARLGMRCVIVANGTPPERLSGNALLDSHVRRRRASTSPRARNARRRWSAWPPNAAGARPAPVRHPARRLHAARRARLRARRRRDGAAGARVGARLHLPLHVVRRHAGRPRRRLRPARPRHARHRHQRRRTGRRPAGHRRRHHRAAWATCWASTARRSRPPGRSKPTTGFVGDGYGIPTAASREAQSLLARTEALVVDHTYTAKALAGMIGWLRDGRVPADATALFWHTGGQVGVFAL